MPGRGRCRHDGDERPKVTARPTKDPGTYEAKLNFGMAGRGRSMLQLSRRKGHRRRRNSRSKPSDEARDFHDDGTATSWDLFLVRLVSRCWDGRLGVALAMVRHGRHGIPAARRRSSHHGPSRESGPGTQPPDQGFGSGPEGDAVHAARGPVRVLPPGVGEWLPCQPEHDAEHLQFGWRYHGPELSALSR